jgi:alpha-glucosidase (family GH31 glycosyl hydrolase)
LATGAAQAAPDWHSGPFGITLDNGDLHLYHNKEKFAQITSFAFNFIPAEIARIKNVTDDGLTVALSLAGDDGFHADFPSKVDLTISHTGSTFRFLASHETFNHVTIRMKELDEHYFGLIEKLYPDNAKSPDLRGETVDVEVYARGEKDYAENYASAYSAFFMSSAGYGSFFDTFAKGRYTFARDGTTKIYHQTDQLDWYLFYGPGGAAIHKAYFDVIGAPKRIPIWAAGPIVWRDHNEGKDQILDDLQKFSDLAIPLTATFVDRPYSHGGHQWSKMDFTEQFANPEDWIATINNRYGLELMTWVGSLTFGDRDFPGLLPNRKSYIDLTHPDALAEFEKRLAENQYSVGVKGHKMDRADEGFPVTAQWHEPISESTSRNKYVYLYSKTIHEFLEAAHGQDQFNFARAAYHRSQPYLGALWGGDNRPNWKGMSGNQANAMRVGFMGFPVWGNDTGGYLGEGRIDEKLYRRWLQWSAWNGLFEVKIDGMGGSGRDRAPWRYSDKLQKVFRQACEQRMTLLPYSYSAANTSAENGVLMKPMAYVYPSDEKTYAIWDQYIFGEAFLIAPLFGPDNTRSVYLPDGTWHDFNDLRVSYQGPAEIKTESADTEIPVFIRGNSIVLTGDIYRGNSRLWKGELQGDHSLTIHLYPGKQNEATEFTYVDYLDNDRHKTMTLAVENGQVNFTSPALTVETGIRIHTETEPESIRIDGEPVPYDYDATTRQATVGIESDTAISLTVNRSRP